MLIERNQVTIGVIAAAVLAAGVFFAIFMTGGMFQSGKVLTAVFTDAAGLADGDQVLVAGVRSGEVQSVEVEGDVANVEFTVDVDLPSDSRARISIQNLLGRRLLHIEAGTAWSELLAEGDVIPVERTNTPIDVPDFGEETEQLSRTTDEEALQSVVTALADVTEGQQEEVAALFDGLTRLGDVIDERRDELEETITRSEQLFRAFADRDQEIVRIIDSFGSTLSMLRERRTDVEQLLNETANTSEVLADLVESERARIDRTLPQLHETLQIVDRNQVDIAHFFAYAGRALYGYAQIGYRGAEKEDNPYWVNMRAQEFGPIGIDVIFGCGGHIDRALDDLFGQDPRSCEEQAAQPRPDETGAFSQQEEGGTLGAPGIAPFFGYLPAPTGEVAP